MSENKRYYWLKLKKDFFDGKMIKILRTFEQGDRMIMTFLKIELHSLENDGYIYYENMLPTFEQELAIAIDEDTELVKTTLETLLRFGAIRKEDENKYYITALEDCIGSETGSARKMRKKRELEQSQCDQNESQCDQNESHFLPEIEKETDIEKELYLEKKRTPSSFSGKKKGGRYGTQNAFFNNEGKKFNKYAGVEKIINSQELVYVPNEEREKYEPATGLLSKPVY